ncbi:MAG: LTA synthase family protein, partial [Muribaculaceae bacterium]|nr:LTA synthase family protein [Muribaculaceae bacterium]
LYYRFWTDVKGLSSAFLVGNINKDLWYSVVGLWRIGDFVILFIPLVLTLMYVKFFRRMTVGKNQKRNLLIACVLLFVGSQCLHTRSVMIWQREIKNELSFFSAISYRFSQSQPSNVLTIAWNGYPVYFLKSLGSALKVVTFVKPLTSVDETTIQNFIESSPLMDNLPDSVMERNGKKNIILIIVESLNSYALSVEIDNRPVTPVLRELIKKRGTLSALNIHTNIKDGRSGDGQLIINTGLYPTVNFSAPVMLGGRNTFPSLALALKKKENIAIFGDDASMWNERQTFGNYGFERIISRNDYSDLIVKYGGDGGMFREGLRIIPSLQQPFLIEFLTVSMHLPFNDPYLPKSKFPQWILDSKSLPEAEKRYLCMVNYFDMELGNFIKQLVEKGLWEDTMLILMSDHPQDMTVKESQIVNGEVMMGMIAANCGVSKEIKRRVEQVDIFTTILNLSGVNLESGWKGAGISMFNDTDRRDERADSISTLILMTDYFGKVSSHNQTL